MNASARRIIGVDPGSRKTGYGVIDCENDRFRLVASGVIAPDTKTEMAVRLVAIGNALAEIVDEFRPTAGAVENVFLSVNARSALTLGQARGVAVYVLGSRGLDVSEISAREVKLAVTGHGAAEKSEVGRMVKLLLGMEKLPREDEADALAVAIAFSRNLIPSRLRIIQ